MNRFNSLFFLCLEFANEANPKIAIKRGTIQFRFINKIKDAEIPRASKIFSDTFMVNLRSALTTYLPSPFKLPIIL